MKEFSKIIISIFIFIHFGCERKPDAPLQSKLLSEKIEVTDLMDDGKRSKTLDSLSYSILKQPTDTVKFNLLFKIAGKYYNIAQYESYRKLSGKILELASQVNDSAATARSLHYIGDYQEVKAQTDSALFYYIKSEKIYRKLKDSLNIGRMQLYKAGILYDIGGFAESESLTVDALRFLKPKGNRRLMYECYMQIALALKELKNFENSLRYFRLAITTLPALKTEGYTEQKILLSKAACLNNMGQVFLKQGKYAQAKLHFENALRLKGVKQDKPSLYAMLLNNLAAAKMCLKETRGIEHMLFQSLEIREDNGLKSGIVSSKIKIGEYYIQQKDTLKALAYIKEGYTLAKEIDSNYDILRALTLLAQHDRDNQLYYTNLYISANDKIYQMEIKTRDKFGRIAYETDIIEERNKILTQKNTIITISGIVASALLLALLYIVRLNSLKKELLYKQGQQESNEKIYKLLLLQQSEAHHARDKERRRIAMDLHDRVVNRVFTTRFNLMQLQTPEESKKIELINELQNTEKDIRLISHDLSNQSLFDDTGFYLLIDNYLKSQATDGRVTYDLYADKLIDWAEVSGEVKINLYSIIQESVQNVKKHSNASVCNIAFFLESKILKLRIWDNGKGIEINQPGTGIGIRNMQDRARNINATLQIESNLGKGTLIEMQIALVS